MVRYRTVPVRNRYGNRYWFLKPWVRLIKLGSIMQLMVEDKVRGLSTAIRTNSWLVRYGIISYHTVLYYPVLLIKKIKKIPPNSQKKEKKRKSPSTGIVRIPYHPILDQIIWYWPISYCTNRFRPFFKKLI